MSKKALRQAVAGVVGVSLLAATFGAREVAAAPPGSLPRLAGDLPIVGDWDGDGRDGIGVFRDGQWLLKNEVSAGGIDSSFTWGALGDVPVVGDWDGDGRDGIGVFRNGQWLLRQTPTGGDVNIQFNWGAAGDVPIVGDWDGDGRDGIGVFRNGRWFVRNNASAGSVDGEFGWGLVEDLPLAGDWDGDGRDGIAVFRKSTWLFRQTATGGSIDASALWGFPSDIPTPGDWDGNRSVGLGVRRASAWLLRNGANDGPIEAQFQWGRPSVPRDESTNTIPSTATTVLPRTTTTVPPTTTTTVPPTTVPPEPDRRPETGTIFRSEIDRNGSVDVDVVYNSSGPVNDLTLAILTPDGRRVVVYIRANTSVHLSSFPPDNYKVVYVIGRGWTAGGTFAQPLGAGELLGGFEVPAGASGRIEITINSASGNTLSVRPSCADLRRSGLPEVYCN